MSRDVAIVVGTVVGAYFGDASAGYAIGSLVGNAYDPQRIQQQGPRLNDLKAQTASYGKMVPVAHGATRLAGNVIWATDVIETAHQQDSGGKGGGPVTSTTTYTYSISCAIALCEGVIGGIGRIWASGKLIYNNSSGVGVDTFIANSNAPFRFYSGTETQTADSLIQAHVGAANTPAYRGIAYVVFENFQLADFGNRMPNFEFEVIQSGSNAIAQLASGTVAMIAVGGRIINTKVGLCALYGGAGNPVVFDRLDSNLNVLYSSSLPTVVGSSLIRGEISSDGTYIYGTYSDNLDRTILVKVHTLTGAFASAQTPGFPSSIGQGTAVVGNFVVTPSSSALRPYLLYVFDPAAMSLVYSLPLTKEAFSCFADSNGYLWIAETGSIIKCSIYDNGSRIIINATYPITNDVNYSNSVSSFLEDADGNIWYIHANAASAIPVKIERITPNGTQTTYTSSYSTIITSAPCLNERNYLYPRSIYWYSQTNSRLEGFDTTTLTFFATTYSSTFSSNLVSLASGVISASNTTIGFGVVTKTPITVDSVVSDICLRAGMTAGQIDVTRLADTIDGYVVQRSTARAQIEQLMQAFYFDAVESDGKVKFVKRGGAPALTIPEDDLAAFLYGGTMPDNLQITRQQEMELPVEVNVQYMDEATSYQVSSQRSQRLITNSVNKLALNFAISMTATKAKQVSDVLMFDAWTARMQFAMAHGWKYSYLEPTDVVQVVKSGRTYNVRIIDEDASGGIYSRTAVMDDSNVYTQTATAAPPTGTGTGVSSPATLDLVLMDIPLLRDQDDGIGFYAAACPYSGTWSGEQTFKSNDGGATWSQSGRAILNAAAIGVASSVLGNFSSGNIFDETNSVTVVMINGTLSSATELSVLNGANVLLLGNEIIQFKSAALVATKTYTLTGLLRGRQGTEWAMSTHAAGDRAVLLSSTTTYIFDSPSSEYNLARKYRGVSLGGFLDDALTVNFTNTGVAQECYSPVQLGGGRDASNNVTLNWTRRTRIGGAWNDYADVPLGEASESYTVQIYSDATYTTLKRTITGITSPTTTYTAAQQTTDGLTPGNPVYFTVYQVSATVGTGYGARGVAF